MAVSMRVLKRRTQERGRHRRYGTIPEAQLWRRKRATQARDLHAAREGLIANAHLLWLTPERVKTAKLSNPAL